jgi:hypothetical protein
MNRRRKPAKHHFQGPVKIGVAADQIENAWHTTGVRSGWFGTGFHADNDEDHCVSLCANHLVRLLEAVSDSRARRACRSHNG